MDILLNQPITDIPNNLEPTDSCVADPEKICLESLSAWFSATVKKLAALGLSLPSPEKEDKVKEKEAEAKKACESAMNATSKEAQGAFKKSAVDLLKAIEEIKENGSTKQADHLVFSANMANLAGEAFEKGAKDPLIKA